jgi:GT2 family glycosyltransferase
MSTPRVAIVILNWNGQKLLEQFLPSVCKTTYTNFKIVVADNGSTDNSVKFIEQHYPAIQLIRLPKNLGYAGGYNQALQQIVADYYVLLNSDVEVAPDWIDPMVDLLESDKSIGACQPKLLSWKQKDHFEYAGAAGGWIDSLGYPFAKGRVLDNCEIDNHQYNNSEPIFWASGAALFIRASTFHSLNGFDPFFFAHQEEIDLCWRTQLAGYKIYSCPAAVVWHVGGSTLPTGNSQKTFLNYRNNHLMLLKNLPLAQLLWVIPVRFALDAVAAWKALFSGDPGYWWAVARAHFAIMVWLIGSKSNNRFPEQRTAPLQGVFKGSILWKYYFKSQKTFGEIVGSPR